MKTKETKDLKLSPELEKEVAGWQGKHRVKFLDIGGEQTTKKKEGKDVPHYVQGKLIFFRMPSRQEMSAAEHLGKTEDGGSDPYKKAEKMLTDCLLGGDYDLETILADVELFMTVANYVLYDLVQLKNVNWGSC